MQKRLVSQVRSLRKKQTPQEMKMWVRLRNRQFHGLKFRRQYMIGRYIVDFICVENKVIIEIDGWQHKDDFSGEREKQRTLFLEAQGYRIVRFWNNDVDKNCDGVFLELQRVVDDIAA